MTFYSRHVYSLYTNVVGISTYKHCRYQENSMEYLTIHHLVENYFQLYTNLVDELTSLVIAIIQFKN
jgi:hypothetical protein